MRSHGLAALPIAAVGDPRDRRTRLMRGALALALGVIMAIQLLNALDAAGGGIYPYRAPSLCAGQPCTAVGIAVVLPNLGLLGVQVAGPAPGVEWTRSAPIGP